MPTPEPVTFKTSRLRSACGALFCFACVFLLQSFLGQRGFFDYLAGGGPSGKIAFATLIMSPLGIFCLVAVFYRPRAIILGQSGLTVRSISDEAEIKWSDVRDVEVGGIASRRGVVIHRPDGPLLIADGMGNSRKIVAAIKAVKDTPSPTTPRPSRTARPMGPKRFGHRLA